MSAFYTKKTFLVLLYLFIGASCSDSDFYFRSFEVKLAENFYNPLLPIVVIDNITEIFEEATADSKITTLKNKKAKNHVIKQQSVANDETQKLHRLATVSLKATEKLAEMYKNRDSYKNSFDDVWAFISKVRLPPPFCPLKYIKETNKKKCNPNKLYRTYDGACNNLVYPWYGSRLTPFQRLLPPDYADRFSTPKGIDDLLPSARELAINLMNSKPTKSDLSAFFLYFGQFVSHDFTQTIDNGANCDCESTDSECFNIPIPKDDYYFKNTECIPFSRSSASPQFFDCYLAPREQINKMTHYLDGNQIYGSTFEDNTNLRTHSKGLLKTSKSPYTSVDLLPVLGEKKGCPMRYGCFFGADTRIEQNVYLTTVHTIFAKEHNRIARALYKINPHWNDERLFQEARRILIAVYQLIIYDKWLPRFLGEKYIKQYKLELAKDGYSNNYNSKAYPQILNEFASASFRLHHLVSDRTIKVTKEFEPVEIKDLARSLFNSSDVYSNFESIARGLLVDRIYESQPHMTPYLNHYLLENIFEAGKSSLGALNVQRGRDHGLPSYNRYREFCGLNLAKDFEDLSTNMDREIVEKLKKVYDNVNDIDLYVGGISEKKIEGGVLGHTFSCINAFQFFIAKTSDRYWFETEDETLQFTSGQLEEIRKSSLSKIICDALGQSVIQKDPFSLVNRKNPFVKCKDLHTLDLYLWKDELPQDYNKD